MLFLGEQGFIRLTEQRSALRLAAMQTLGLQGESKRSDGRLKSLFWPTVENAWDVDYLGQQGFWVCLIISVFQFGLGVLLGGGNLFVIVLGFLGAITYFAGGIGVREKSWPAAAVVLALGVFDFLAALASGALLSPVGAVRVLVIGLLFSNLRATFIASEWKPPAEGEDHPERFSETFFDKLVDIWPPKLWPVLRIPFYVLGSLWCLVSLFGLLAIALMRLGLVHVPVPH